MQVNTRLPEELFPPLHTRIPLKGDGNTASPQTAVGNAALVKRYFRAARARTADSVSKSASTGVTLLG